MAENKPSFFGALGNNLVSGTVGSIFGGINGLISGAINDKYNRRNLERQQNYWKEQFNMQNQRQDYLLQNQSAMELLGLKNAGLNPTWQGQAGSVGAVANPSAPLASAGSSPTGASISDFAAIQSQMAQTKLINKQAEGQEIANDFARKQNPQTLENLRLENNKLTESINQIKADIAATNAVKDKTEADNTRAQELQSKLLSEYDEKIKNLQQQSQTLEEQRKWLPYHYKSERMQAEASKQQAAVAKQMADIARDRFEFESGTQWKIEYTERYNRIVGLIADNKAKKAAAEIAEFEAQVRKEQGKEWAKWMGENGYITRALSMVLSVADTGIKAYLVGRNPVLGAAASITSSNPFSFTSSSTVDK